MCFYLSFYFVAKVGSSYQVHLLENSHCMHLPHWANSADNKLMILEQKLLFKNSRLYFISFGIIEPILVSLKIEYHLSWC